MPTLDAFTPRLNSATDPRLAGKPVIVGGGVVLAASYEARDFGVRGAMGGGRLARRLSPQAIIVDPRDEAYSAASTLLSQPWAAGSLKLPTAPALGEIPKQQGPTPTYQGRR